MKNIPTALNLKSFCPIMFERYKSIQFCSNFYPMPISVPGSSSSLQSCQRKVTPCLAGSGSDLLTWVTVVKKDMPQRQLPTCF